MKLKDKRSFSIGTLATALIFLLPATWSNSSTLASALVGGKQSMKMLDRNNNSISSKRLATNAPKEEEKEDKASKVAAKTWAGTYNPLRLAVLKLGMTELRFTSPLNYEKRSGEYLCANCGTKLFDSIGKYDSGSGWPSFYKTAASERVSLKREWDGRMECTCQNCGGHLGHVFPDGPRRMDVPQEALQSLPKTDPKIGDVNNQYSRLPRFCINGASLKFSKSQTN